MNKKNLSIPAAIIIAGIIIAAAIFIGKDGAKPRTNQGDDENSGLNFAPVNQNDHILGNPDATLIIVEFSDTECPFCKKFHEAMRQLMDEYGKNGKVAWVYRHMPLDALHKKSRTEAGAAECAAELGGNGKFWEYINKIYEITPSNDGLDLAELPRIAEEIGLDKNRFEDCLNSGRRNQDVENDYQDAIKAGIQGTPYGLIIAKDNKKLPINGFVPYQQLKIAVDQLLSEIK